MRFSISFSVILCFFCHFLFIDFAEARWATFEDAASSAVINGNWKINADGTGKWITEMRIRILKEQARYLASLNFQYNASREKMRVIEAKTIVNGKEYPVKKEDIEDKPLASSPQGFDQMMQILVSFQNVEIGSEIYIKYETDMLKSLVDDFFSERINFGDWMKTDEKNIKIESAIPLYISVNDPLDVLEVKKDSGDKVHNINISLKKPVYRSVIGQSEEGGLINPKDLVWVSLSSVSEWKDLDKKIAPKYEKVLKQDLPPVFQEIAKEAKNLKDDVAKINFVTSTLSQKITYMGDWRSVEGRYFPRDLEKIASSQIGDCKDFSVSAGAILQSLGFKVNVALVVRGLEFHPVYIGLPESGAFNHAFLKVVSKSGKVYWIDPTNFISMAQAIFPDIAGKMALVLDSKNPTYEKVPEVSSENMVKFTEYLEIKDDVTFTGELTLTGSEASEFTGYELYLSEDELRDRLFVTFSGEHLDAENKKDLVIPNLKSRIVEDLTFKFSFVNKDYLLKTNLGLAFRSSGNPLSFLAASAKDRMTDVRMTPYSSLRKLIIKNIKLPNITSLNFDSKTPWFDLNRTCKHSGNDTEIITTLVIKKTIIESDVLRSPEFKKAKEDVLTNFKNTVFVLGNM